MKQVRTIPWPRVIAEGAIIVVSILLAFWIDAWWDRRGASEQEAVLLKSLLADLQDLQAYRQGRDEYIDEIIESARKLLDIGRSSEKPATDREIDFLLEDLTYLAGLHDQGSSVLKMLFSGGALADIQSNELRTALTDLRFALDVEEAQARREQAFIEEQFYPYLDLNASLAQIWGASDGQPGSATVAYSADDYPIGREAVLHSEISHRGLLEDRTFQNLLIRRILTLTNVKGWEDSAYDVDARLQDNISLIEEILVE